MLFKSALTTMVSGKIGGLVGSHNRGGQYFRAWVVPTNPSSPGQQAVRTLLSVLASRWAILTSAQRDAWTMYGLNVPTTNRIGDVIYLTGQQWYIACNVARIRGGLSIVDDGPVIFLQDSLNPVSINTTPASQDVDVFFTDTDEWVGEDDAALIVQVGIQVLTTINFYKGPFVFAAKIDGDSVAPPVPPVTITSPRPPHVAGGRVWARVRSVRADGRMSPPQIIFDDSV